MSELKKETEAQLWDSFREGEARERALRKQLARLVKAKSTVDVQNELLQSQLREEQDKPPPIQLAEATQAITKKIMSHKVKSRYITELENKLKRYEGINVENLIQELLNKTALAEELLEEKREKERLMNRPGSIRRESIRRTSVFNNNQQDSLNLEGISGFSSHRPSISKNPEDSTGIPNLGDRGQSATTNRTAFSPAFGLSAAAAAAEPVDSLPEHRSFGKERINELELENKALRRKLFLNGITLPPESKKSLAHPSVRLAAESTSKRLSYRPRTANTESRPITANSNITDSRMDSRPMTAASRPVTALSRPRTAASHSGGILKKGQIPSIPQNQNTEDKLPEISQKKLMFADP